MPPPQRLIEALGLDDNFENSHVKVEYKSEHITASTSGFGESLPKEKEVISSPKKYPNI